MFKKLLLTIVGIFIFVNAADAVQLGGAGNINIDFFSGSVEVVGGLTLSQRTATASGDVTINDYNVWCDTTAEDLTQTLPTVASSINLVTSGSVVLNVLNIGTGSNTCTLSATGSEVIFESGSSSGALLLNDGDSRTVQTNGTQWFVY